ncbi:MAG TPA: ATP-binding protein [Pyrinomonadaceae bacterium]|nr:ATP-binding protein [Pyrinomonadaceae bacterium]
MHPGLEHENTSVLSSAIARWVTENSTQGAVATDAELKVSFCNRWIEKATGKLGKDIKGQSLFSVFPEIESRGLGHYYEQALRGESRVLSHSFHHYLLEVAAPSTDSGIDFMQQSCRIAPLVDNEKVVGTITIIEDVTERVLRERELRAQIGEKELLLQSELAARQLAEENSRVKDEFLATVSHEIRSPLNAIKGWSQILRRSAVDSETFNHALDTIDRNVTAQSELIEDLLDISRMVTGQLKLELQPVDLVEILNSAIDSMSPAASAKDLKLTRTFGAKAAFVLADRERIQQVLWNLLSNAIKFTPEKGRVEVTLLEDEGFVRVAVSDDGIGILPDFVPYVFDRFRQGDGGRRRRHGGLGLGLSIVKNLVALHGGTVAVESLGEGAGATFTLRLPRLAFDEDEVVVGAMRMPSPDTIPTASLNYKILIVDDDEDARETLRMLLSIQNANVVAAGSAQEALEIFEEFRPDLLLSDIGMPGMDGYDLIRRIRSLPPEKGGGVPAIALTGYVSVEEQSRVREFGFNGHLSKPLDHGILIKRIGELLD